MYLLDHAYGEFVGELCEEFCSRNQLKPDLIAWHGHTVFHDPEQHATCQIGHGASLAAVTGRPVVCQFRNIDVALGGQGAPLAPLADKHLLPGADCYINLGGISNLSYREGNQFISFDVSPCNQILDRLAKQLGMPYDDRGRETSRGKLDVDLLNQLNQWPYYRKTPPKSLDNGQVIREFWPFVNESSISVRDKLRTMTEHIAYQLAEVIKQAFEDQPVTLAITGGGAFNHYLLECLKSQHTGQNIEILSLSEEIIAFKEAALMGLMGFFYHQRIPNVYQSVTGASTDHIGGSLFQGWKNPLIPVYG